LFCLYVVLLLFCISLHKNESSYFGYSSLLECQTYYSQIIKNCHFSDHTECWLCKVELYYGIT
jgi:hypothetical protein